jgi:hypothetical protein
MIPFGNQEDLPKCTETGFQLVKCPQRTWDIIQEMYRLLKLNPKKEEFKGMEEIIFGQNGQDLFSFDQIPTIRGIIHQQLLPIHQNWSNQKLIPTWIYGIRSYNNGAQLVHHVDQLPTHHISAIIIVDKELNGEQDWPLDIQAHDGTWHKIYAEPGDMILYESAICEHGRMEPFKGKFFRNFYVHYRFADYQFAAPKAE